MTQFVVSSFYNTVAFMHQNDNVEGLRFVKHVVFDWPKHLGFLPSSGEKVRCLIGRTSDLVDVYDVYNDIRKFTFSVCKVERFFYVNPVEVVFGKSKIHNQAIELISDSLSVYATFASEFFLINLSVVKLIETVSTMAAIARNMQTIYLVLSSDNSNKNHIEVKAEIVKELAKLTKNIVSLSENLLKESLKQTLMLSCGSAAYVAKITLFAMQRNLKK